MQPSDFPDRFRPWFLNSPTNTIYSNIQRNPTEHSLNRGIPLTYPTMQLNICSHLQHRGSHHCQCMPLTMPHGCPYTCMALSTLRSPWLLQRNQYYLCNPEYTTTVPDEPGTYWDQRFHPVWHTTYLPGCIAEALQQLLVTVLRFTVYAPRSVILSVTKS
ncbi:hypothetical protein BDV37DRAFT_260698, partial [Aspergillus pseudonomiae]